MNPTHKFSKVLFCIRDFQIPLKSGLSLAKSLVLRYQLENKSIRPTLINFFSKCINKENHQPFDFTLSLSLCVCVYIYYRKNRWINQVGTLTSLHIYNKQLEYFFLMLLFVKVRNNKRKGSVISNRLGIFSQWKKKNISILPTNFSNTPSNNLSIIFSILLKLVLVTRARHVYDSLH